MTQDTEQPRTRLDAGDGIGLSITADNEGDYMIVLDFPHDTVEFFLSHAEAQAAQREAEDALIRRALRVATDAEAREAGWVRPSKVQDIVFENVGLTRLAHERLGVSYDSIRATVASQASEYMRKDDPRADLSATMRHLAVAMTDAELAEAGLVRLQDHAIAESAIREATRLFDGEIDRAPLFDAALERARQHDRDEDGGAS